MERTRWSTHQQTKSTTAAMTTFWKVLAYWSTRSHCSPSW